MSSTADQHRARTCNETVNSDGFRAFGHRSRCGNATASLQSSIENTKEKVSAQLLPPGEGFYFTVRATVSYAFGSVSASPRLYCPLSFRSDLRFPGIESFGEGAAAPSLFDETRGISRYGSLCPEMDLQPRIMRQSRY